MNKSPKKGGKDLQKQNEGMAENWDGKSEESGREAIMREYFREHGLISKLKLYH